jgi:hypothetical protein
MDVMVFIFNGQLFDFFPGKSSSWSSSTDSELLFHRTKLNFAGAQRDYFIIMITEVPVRSYGPIYSSKMSR